METLGEAKQFLRDNWEEGCACPCCGQFVKRYTYNLNRSVGLTLIKIFTLHKNHDVWVHVNTEIRPESGGYFSIAKHWGLIVQREKEETDDKRVSGYWAITAKGRKFIVGEITVPKAVEMFDGRVLKFSDEQITIQQCLGDEFSYKQLMGPYLTKDEPLKLF